MNTVAERLAYHIKRVHRSKEIPGTLAFVMDRVTHILLGEDFKNVPRVCVDPNGFKFHGCRLFLDTTLPQGKNYFFSFEVLKKRMPELYKKENDNGERQVNAH